MQRAPAANSVIPWHCGSPVTIGMITSSNSAPDVATDSCRTPVRPVLNIWMAWMGLDVPTATGPKFTWDGFHCSACGASPATSPPTP